MAIMLRPEVLRSRRRTRDCVGTVSKMPAGPLSSTSGWKEDFWILTRELMERSFEKRKKFWWGFEALEETRSKSVLLVPRTMITSTLAYLCAIDVCEVILLAIAAQSAQCLVLAIKLL